MVLIVGGKLVLTGLRREHLQEHRFPWQQIDSLAEGIGFVQDLQLDRVTINARQYLLTVVVAEDELGSSQLLLGDLYLLLFQVRCCILDVFEYFLHAFLGGLLPLDDVVIIVTDLLFNLGLLLGSLEIWQLHEVVWEDILALEFIIEIEYGIGHSEFSGEEVNLAKLSLRIVQENLVDPCANNQSLQIHHFVLHDSSQFLNSRRHHHCFDTFGIGEVHA